MGPARMVVGELDTQTRNWRTKSANNRLVRRNTSKCALHVTDPEGLVGNVQSLAICRDGKPVTGEYVGSAVRHPASFG